MENRTFGIELEFSGMSRKAACKIVAVTLSGCMMTEPELEGGYYSKYVCYDSQNRKWTVMSDGSVRECTTFDIDTGEQCELVTPILKGSKDIELLQEVVRALKQYGAKVDSSCGLHVHIGIKDFSALNMRNLAFMWHKNEDMFFNAFKVDEARELRFCKRMDEHFVEDLQERPTSRLCILDLFGLYYRCAGSYDAVTKRWGQHYNRARYHALNFHSYGVHKTIEFRLFNSTLHAGKVKTYIQFALAFVNLAAKKKRADPTPAQSDNQAYLMHCLINQLGLKGKKYATCRMFLLKYLSGSTAWRHVA